jgi:hypothetical protein
MVANVFSLPQCGAHRFIAIQTKQALHDARLHHTDYGTALIAA